MMRRIETAGMMVLLIFLGLIVVWGMASQKIKRVAVFGAPEYREEEIIKILKPWLHDALFFFPVAEASDRLYEKLPLSKAEIGIDWPDGLRITVQFRQASMWMVTSNGVFGLDNEGVRLDRVYASQDEIPVLVEGCEMDSTTRLTACSQKAVALFHQLLARNIPVEEIGSLMINADQMQVRMADKLLVRLGDDSRLSEKIQRLGECLKWFEEKKIGVRRLDLFDPDQPVARLSTAIVS